MQRTLSTDVRRRMGVYKRLSEVPDQYLLENFEASYRGKNTALEYVEGDFFGDNPSERRQKRGYRFHKSWTEHMDSYEVHHALAEPQHVEQWLAELLDGRTTRYIYQDFWTRIEQFFNWLQCHTEHPHVYHPPRMAVLLGGAAQEIWDFKMSDYERQFHEGDQ